MKTYLKHTILFISYHPVSYLAGGLIAGLSSIILGALFETNREPIQNVVQPVLITMAPLAFLFFFLQRDAYENRRFSPLLIIGSSIPLFLVQLILVLHNQLGMTLVGGVGIVTRVFFPNTENPLHYALVQIGLQLLIYLPTYLLASHYGYKRRLNENKRMITEHQQTVQ